MKTATYIIAFSISLLCAGHSATITVDTSAFVNYSDGSTRVTDNTGTVAVGTYNSEPTFAGNPSVSDVITGFDELGSGAFEDSLGNLDGFFRFNMTETITSAFDSKAVYIVLGNADTLSGSDQFLVWKATSNPDGNTFTADNPLGGPGSIKLDNTAGSLLLGGFSSEAFILADAVPEPSSAALLGLGGLALLMRRRRESNL